MLGNRLVANVCLTLAKRYNETWTGRARDITLETARNTPR